MAYVVGEPTGSEPNFTRVAHWTASNLKNMVGNAHILKPAMKFLAHLAHWDQSAKREILKEKAAVCQVIKGQLEGDDHVSVELVASCVEALAQSSLGSQERQDELASLENGPLEVVSYFPELKDDPSFPALLQSVCECSVNSPVAKNAVVETYEGFSFLSGMSFDDMSLDLCLALALFVTIFVVEKINFSLRPLVQAFHEKGKFMESEGRQFVEKAATLL